MNVSAGPLQVFVSKGCRGCKLAMELADRVRKMKPQLGVEVIDISKEPTKGGGLVVAVPAYVHDGRLLFLGNPSPQELQSWLDNLDREVPDVDTPGS